MARFAWDAVDAAGRSSSGVVDAAGAADAAARLRASELWVVSMRPLDAAESTVPAEASAVERFAAPRARTVARLLGRMALMTRSGLTVLQALDVVGRQSGSRSAERACERIAARVRSGRPLSRALAAEPHVFPEVAVQLVQGAEASGELDQALDRAAEHLERRLEVRAAVLSSLLYPAIVVATAIGVVSYLVLKVVPKFARYLEGRSVALPASARFLLALQEFLETWGLVLVGGVVLLVVALLLARRSERGRLAFDRTALRVPVVGGVLSLGATARLAEGLGLLLRSGVGLLEALRVTARGVGNRAVAADVERAAARVLQGTPLSEAMRAPAVPALVAEVVAVGERTGELESVLRELGRFYQRELSARLEQITSLVEPVMVLVIGGIVGFVYFTFFQIVLQTAQ